jgi:hypothetical protein
LKYHCHFSSKGRIVTGWPCFSRHFTLVSKIEYFGLNNFGAFVDLCKHDILQTVHQQTVIKLMP